jgi:subtilisin family serine protease
MRSRQKPEISAPGAGIVAARAHGGVTLMSGTSMAAAHVTGVVALLFQLAQRAGLPRLSIQETREILIQSAQPRDGEPLSHRLGAGSVDGAAALKRLLAAKNLRTEAGEETLNRPYTQDILRILAAQLSQTSQVLDRLIQN